MEITEELNTQSKNNDSNFKNREVNPIMFQSSVLMYEIEKLKAALEKRSKVKNPMLIRYKLMRSE